jgi:histidinol-phosphate/aromatic aminotransferase/cobyric acid decarboxylase-like protein
MSVQYTVNAKIGNPLLQAEILACALENVKLPPQDIITLPYTYRVPEVPSFQIDTFNTFVLGWEKKIHTTNVLLNKRYNIATSTGGSSLSAVAFLHAVVQQLTPTQPVVRVTSYLPPPTYSYYETICTQFLKGVEWVYWVQDENGNWIRPVEIDVVVVISPNNPTGEIVSEPVFNAPYVLVDTVYDNYIFTGVYRSVNPWLWRYLNFSKPGDPVVGMVSTFSKIGFAGFRTGYLFTNSPSLLAIAQSSIDSFYLGSSTYNYFALIQNNPALNQNYFCNVYQILRKRQEQIRLYIPKELIVNKNCVAPYLFVQIDPQRFANCGILVQIGTAFSFPPTYSRISLMIPSPEWKRLIRILQSGCLL